MPESSAITQSNVTDVIRSKIKVTPQRIAIAKAQILEACVDHATSQELINAVLSTNGAQMPEQLNIGPSTDPTSSIAATAEAITWLLAAAEAILSLVHTGMLVSMGGFTVASDGSIRCDSGGYNFALFFPELKISLPTALRPAASLLAANDQFLAEPDLYLDKLAIPNMHPEIAGALQEAVKCFRSELFTATVAMLGKASEGAWIGLGGSLMALAPTPLSAPLQKHSDTLQDPMAGTMKKIKAVTQLYERHDLFAAVYNSSGIKPPELQGVSLWSDLVRDSRNTIHFGVTPATPNTYEKVACLLLAAVPNLKVLYALKSAADALAHAAPGP